MSKMTREINRISLAVIGVSGKLIFLALLIVLLVLGAKEGYSFGHSIFYSPAMEEAPGTTKEITLTGRESVLEVGERLEKEGLIRHAQAFAVQAVCYEYEVQAGTYELSTAQSSQEIIDILKKGETADGGQS